MSDRRVWLVQCLCGPRRHAIMAHAFEASAHQAAVSIDEYGPALAFSIDHLIEQRVINPWCQLCGAGRAAWQFEIGRTQFETLEQAGPHLRACENEQRQAAEEAVRLRRAAPLN